VNGLRDGGLRRSQLRGVPVGADATDAALPAVGERAPVSPDRAAPWSLQAALHEPQATDGAPRLRHAAVLIHGTAHGYRLGCRCLPCAHARAVYRQSDGHRAPRVDATPAREHLQRLAQRGIGLTQASRLSGIARPTLQAIRNGTRRSIAARLEEAIASIPAIPAMGALTSGYPVRRMLAWFRLEGFTKADIARRLGLRTPHVQFVHRCCTYRTAARVRALYRKVAQV